MSESKAQLEREKRNLREQLNERTHQLVELIDYVVELERKHPEIDCGDMPSYEESIWRQTSV